MANGYSVFPVGNPVPQEVIEFLENELVFLSPTLPDGRFPTLSELRESIHELGYELEEAYDWYATSADDHTEIWFRGADRQENKPVEFWFRRGDLIVLDIAQAITNCCGSLIVIDHTGLPTVLLVPNEVFSEAGLSNPRSGFIEVISARLATMTERLAEASTNETLFVLSQIRQALRRMDRLRHYEVYQAAQHGLPAFIRLLNHADARIRFMAFDLAAAFRERFYDNSEQLRLAIKREPDPDTKTRMIYAVEHLVVRDGITDAIHDWTYGVLDLLLELCETANEFPAVRLAATNLLARSRPGFHTVAMQSVFTNALIQPERYKRTWYSEYAVVEQVLISINRMLLAHRIGILLEALPGMSVAQYAHEVLRALLDHAFFGTARSTVMSSLPDTQVAERPHQDPAKFRDNLSRNWSYPANPTKLTPAELLPFQHTVLQAVIALDVPWMVHSNLLEKYGLPPTRAAVRALLETNK